MNVFKRLFQSPKDYIIFSDFEIFPSPKDYVIFSDFEIFVSPKDYVIVFQATCKM